MLRKTKNLFSEPYRYPRRTLDKDLQVHLIDIESITCHISAPILIADELVLAEEW